MNHKNLSLLALAIAGVLACGTASAVTTSTLTVDATLTAACEVSPTAQISFGTFDALLSTGDRDANSGVTFQVACTTGAAPEIYASATRAMVNGASSLPFNLSLSLGGAELGSTDSTAEAIAITQDGTMQPVVLYARVLAADFASLPAVAYTGDVSVSVVY